MKRRFLIIGQVMVDVLHPASRPVVRMGGILHAARGFAAMEQEVTIAYVAPAYLEKQLKQHIDDLPYTTAVKIGNIEGTPNVVLVGEATEAGNQGYEYILEHDRSIDLDEARLKALLIERSFTDVLIFPDSDELNPIFRLLNKYTIEVHVDANFKGSIPKMVRALGRPLKTLMASTSSLLFSQKFAGKIEAMRQFALHHAETFVFKENRGGSRLWTQKVAAPLHAPAFVGETAHSVGVGDCFDAVYLSTFESPPALRLRMASLAAQHYAMTLTTPDFFKNMKRLNGVPVEMLSGLQGISLPWEIRSQFHIYIAAPDFEHVNVRVINEVESALKYHNLTPHRPVKEHGEIKQETPRHQRLTTALKDIELLKRCQALIAIPIYPDPGTYIEVGYALEAGIPVFVYAPFKFQENLLAVELPELVTGNLDRLISAIFEHAQRQLSR